LSPTRLGWLSAGVGDNPPHLEDCLTDGFDSTPLWLAQACNLKRTRFDHRMFPYISLTKDKQWKPGPYPGVELMVLHQNEQTGGVTVLRKFRAGVTVPAHVHPQANEFVYVLSGEWEESGVTYTTGAFFFAPRGVAHGPHVAKTEVISLTIFDGPLTVASADSASANSPAY
jgi:quercetin dioxygenase-like cupin family protein